ncbi:MAG: crotonase [Coxiella sp. RIFCSPHIGHO2_12_FULL_42_15]|nr:MAG: crotonase [Coxiella sp. RIFCSPHIGHO2_12_FULL_42_15]
MTDIQYKHWRMETDNENVLWLYMDRQDTAVNSLSRDVFDEFDRMIKDIIQRAPSAVILASGKKKGFIAGADVTQFSSLKNTDEAFDLIRQAQIVLDRFEALPMPTVAMISGFCLGGGCEVALSCTYRVAEDIPSTRIGLPEVKLGIQPGWGGTVRLPALIGAPAAMKIMLPGADLSALKAYKVGLVDACVPTRELKRAAHYFATKKPPRHRPKGFAYLSNVAWVRPILGKFMLRQLTKKVREDHYPAPFAIVRNWMKEGIGRNAYITEAKSIAKLLVTNTSRQLVRVFFLQNRLKALAKNSKFNAQHIHVIGAGTMGGDIAAWCAYKGLRVTLQDQSPERIAPAIQRAYQFYKEKLKIPRNIQAVMDRLQPDVEGNGLRQADVVIEAVYEDLVVKQDIFKKAEAQLKPGAILATNTSSIPLDEISRVLKDPSRLVGIHFFNPVAKMQLVEVVHSNKTSQQVVNDALSFVGSISRLPLPVQATPGFLINRILMPYLLEAMKIYEEGVSAEVIDKSALEFGMPMGPMTLADTVGLDICLSVAKILTKYYGGELPKRLEQMVAEGKLGCKRGAGFYQYVNGKKVSSANAPDGVQSDIIDRMVLAMVNEAILCLQQNVVEDADLLDIGMIFGTGFAPFTGGPIQYARERGWKTVQNRLQTLAERYGDRFRPVDGAMVGDATAQANHEKRNEFLSERAT